MGGFDREDVTERRVEVDRRREGVDPSVAGARPPDHERDVAERPPQRSAGFTEGVVLPEVVAVVGAHHDDDVVYYYENYYYLVMMTMTSLTLLLLLLEEKVCILVDCTW